MLYGLRNRRLARLCGLPRIIRYEVPLAFLLLLSKLIENIMYTKPVKM